MASTTWDSTWRGFTDEEISRVKRINSGTAKSPDSITVQSKTKNLNEPDEERLEEDTIVTTTTTKTIDCHDDNEPIIRPNLLQSPEALKQENIERRLKIETVLKARCESSSKEVEKLQLIKQELSKIEDLVTSDVGLLREKIEEADRNFNRAKRRFDSAEKEYVASKLEFFQAKERKELLSEHLCAIINHNETLKAQKLKTLMSNLHIINEEDTSPNIFTTTTCKNTPAALTDPIPLGTSMINIQRLD